MDSKMSRRAVSMLPLVLLGSTNACADVQLTYGSGSFSGSSVVNGVLSAYGLPQLPDTKGFTPFLSQYQSTVVEFVFPSSWVVNDKAKFSKTGLRRGQTGVSVGDYRTAEGLQLFSLPLSGLGGPPAASVDQLDPKVIADLVIDGGATTGSQASGYKLARKAGLPQAGYAELEFRWDSVTVSGYEVPRVGLAAATVSKGTLYVLFSVVSQQRYPALRPALEIVAASFRVYTL